MKNPQVSAELLEKYLNGTCTENERALVEAWYSELDKASTATSEISQEEKQVLFNEAFTNISERIDPSDMIDEPTERGNQFYFQWNWMIGIAASLLLVVGYFYFQKTPNKNVIATIKSSNTLSLTALQEFVNREKQIVKHILPDSSTIWMRPNAKVQYPSQFEIGNRTVQFNGEGFFEVKKDPTRPFYIHSGEMTVRVLGTSFNVLAPNNQKEFKISVVTGSVEVSAPDEKSQSQMVVLKPNQQALFQIDTKKLYSLKIPPMAKMELYQSSTFAFQNEKISDVIKELEKRFNIKIVLSKPHIGACTLNADFENQPLPAIIEMLCRSLESNYTIEENTIRIDGEPCTI